MNITKKHISRRMMLRGLGAAVALPFLDAMVPALTAQARTAAAAQFRLGCVYLPHGVLLERWTPRTTGSGFEFTPQLKPLESFKEQVTVVSGTALQNVGSVHLTASAMWLSGVPPKRTEAADVGLIKTVDQLVADKIGQDTALPSMELGINDMTGAIGACDGGYSCLYMNVLSWRTPTTPMPWEINPRVVFERMFGDTGTPAERLARIRYRRSLLDSITDAASRLQTTLGSTDRTLVAEYLDNIREVERRIENLEKQAESTVPVPDAPTGVPQSYEEHVTLMYDLAALAFQADITRVFTFSLATEGNQIPYPWIGVRDGHHSVSHHRNEEARKDVAAKIHLYHYELLARFVEKLRATPDGDGNLLDHSLLLYGSGMSDANIHRRDTLPAVVIGGAAGRVKGWRHLAHPQFTPLANLHLAIAQKAGVEIDSFGDSNGKVDL